MSTITGTRVPLGQIQLNNKSVHKGQHKTTKRNGKPQTVKSISKHDMGTQTTPTEEESTVSIDYKMVTSVEPPLEYWKLLAEKRRVALIDTLKENEQLIDRVEQLTEELRQSKNDATYFALLSKLND